MTCCTTSSSGRCSSSSPVRSAGVSEMLETMREFAGEQLRDDRDADRIAGWCQALEYMRDVLDELADDQQVTVPSAGALHG